MEWLGNGASMFPGDGEPPRGPCSDPAAAASSTSSTSSNPHQQMTSSALLGDSVMASLCQSQQSRVKASIISNWRLAEAQDQLCSLGVHSSESLEQERARTMLCPTELSHTEEEWRRKESMLGGPSPSHSPVLGAVGSWDVFDKSIINAQNKPEKIVHERSKPFQQKYEQELRHFGMLRRWDDSQRFLSDQPQLICEETANYLILWCFRLQQEEKEALMEQVAHQAVVMQFILEMATSSEQDPRCCFRQFFHKAKAGQEGYLDVFHSELEAFKRRVKDYTVKSKGGGAPKDAEHQSANAAHRRLDPKEVLETLPPELKAGFQLQDMQILQNVLSTMNPQVAEYHAKRFLEAGLWTNTGRWTKDDGTETDDMRMMETS